ncbi:hypothetical protein AAVH_04392 [Aphelenchoides avenae]|nr:hypothetical protein AAVH_04392 [Aphelenchus avenae]
MASTWFLAASFACVLLEVSFASAVNSSMSLENSTKRLLANGTEVSLAANASEILNATVAADGGNDTVSELEAISNPVHALLRYYDEERDRIQNFIEDPANRPVLVPILIGVLSAIATFLLLCAFRMFCNQCSSRRRRAQIVTMGQQLGHDRKTLLGNSPFDDDDI